MAKAKTKSKNSTLAIIIAIILVLALAVGAVFLLTRNDNKPASVMECSVNPDCQIVLNSQNRVLSVNYLNDDAEMMFSSVDFTNKTADEATKMFVDIATKSGHISLDINGTGAEVTITISAKSGANMENLQKKVTEKVNQYFADNGILAKAVCEVQEGFENALKNIDSTVTDLSNKTEQEILDELNKTSQDIDKIARSLQDDFFTGLKNLKESLNYVSFEKTFDSARNAVDNIQSTIEGYEKTLNDKDVSEVVKETTKPLLKAAKEELKVLKDQLNKAEKELNNVKKELNNKLDELIKELEEQSKTIYENLKTEYNNQVEAFKATLDAHKEAFENNKAEYTQKIKDFQSK